MAKSKRLLDILLFVTAKKKFTAQEIADEFHISIRTVHRYIVDLCDIGLPIYAEQGRNGGYTVLTHSFLPPILFTEEEAVSIFFAFQSLKYYRSLPFEAEITSVEHKLYNSLQREAKSKVDKIRSHIAFWNPKRTIDSPLLNEMLEYSIGNRDVHIHYESKTGVREKHIRPIGVYAHDGLWYLPAYDYDKKKILLFRVDRILSIISNEENKDKFMSLEDWFNFQEVKKPIRLHVYLTMEGVRQCKSVPYFEGVVVTQEDGTGYIDSIIDKDELDFISPLFLRLGRHTRIIEPKELIDGIRRRAEEILTMYQE
ncbi:helix-turn-helix transcriptional regulator [Metabacillus niabensis]|uniref:helix-turn-helix transcriptional regulator n=1 Tax=Metabacillus niabensis TaxID=324854 RepID=UPI001CFB328D|nr:YafY family protein [Metabacillus niabensis]